MGTVVWVGAGLTVLGVMGVVWSLLMVLRARRARLPDDALRLRIQAALPVNVLALLFSMLGLGLVVVGLLLG